MVDAYRENKNTSHLERTLENPRSKIRNIVKKNNKKNQTNLTNGIFRKSERNRKEESVYGQRKKQTTHTCVIYENRRRTYEDMTGIVYEGNNHRFCTITMKRIFKILDKNRVLPTKKSRSGRSTKKFGVSVVKREEIGVLIMIGINWC